VNVRADAVLPMGTVTFLFTDIEGSTRVWEAHPEVMRVALARHDALMREKQASEIALAQLVRPT
jgi:class 3 adenylate cyclase